MARRAPAVYRRLSESPVWSAQRRFYERAGIEAWRTATVPHHVTSNVALATAYARVVLGFLRDGPRPSRREPLTIVELGAGSGRFTFLLLRALEALEIPVRYVMTDVAEATLDFWRTHEALAPFLRDGRLEVARFDAEHDDRLVLERARRTIAPGTPAARLVVVANYVFSGLRQDAFAVRAGRVHDYLAATTLPPRSRGNAADVSFSWRMGTRAGAPYQEDELNAILREDATTKSARRLLFPVAALRCLTRLAAFAREDLLVLAADRGTTEEAEAVVLGADLGLGRHGAVSFPVSFRALRAWVARRGGQALRPPPGHRHVHVAGFLLGSREHTWPETRLAYDKAVAGKGPDELYALRRRLSNGATQLRPPELIALMRLCGHDPRVVGECVRPLWPYLADAGPALRENVRDAVLSAWPNYFHLGEAHDLAFSLALLLYEVRAYAQARTLFEESLRLYGEHGATLWNLGLCYVVLGRPDEAIASFQRAHVLAPDLPPAGLALVKAVRYSRPSSEAPGTAVPPPRRRERLRRSSSPRRR